MKRLSFPAIDLRNELLFDRLEQPSTFFNSSGRPLNLSQERSLGRDQTRGVRPTRLEVLHPGRDSLLGSSQVSRDSSSKSSVFFPCLKVLYTSS